MTDRTALGGRYIGVTALAAALALAACSSGGEPGNRSCTRTGDCPDGRVCRGGTCQPPGNSDGGMVLDAGTRDSGTGSADAGADACTPCGTGNACCTADESCLPEGVCARTTGPCESHNDCSGDRYCHPSLGECVPYGTPSGKDRDPECNRVIAPGTFAPTVQCEFEEVPPGDPFPEHLHVLATPMVADFRIGRDDGDPPAPSIVAVFDDGEDGSSEEPTGVIRILDGETCEQQGQLGELQKVSHSSPPALGDLTGNGRPEIVAFKAGGGLVAFHYDADAENWTVLWRSTTPDGSAFNPTGGGWSGPAIHDLNDDGTPEVLRHGMVFDNQGVLLDQSLGQNLPGYDQGVFPVVADVDDDGLAEHVQGHGVWQWDPDMQQWVAEPWSPGGTTPGHAAIADFGDYPGGQDWPADMPEVAVVSDPGGGAQVRVQTLDGTTVFGPVPLPGGGLGGPPTVADFDGDERREIASAGEFNYVVFDLDCTQDATGECASGRTDGILWLQPSQDESSNRTGSSVFDFEGDGSAEAVYGDECFVRVYDGTTGEVVFSQLRSSCTWYENPVIADADGDFNAEIVMGNNFNCGTADNGVECTKNVDANNIDQLFAGLRCSEDADCLSGNCDAGLCRCTTDDQCCSGPGCDEAGFVCAPPPDGTPGSGNTCRASHPQGARGIRVYRDTADRWVRSRMIWNQHPYAVTNVHEDGTIPATSARDDNWDDPSLNNFRQNVQGDPNTNAAPDLTSRRTPVQCTAEGTARLESQVCNRGVQPVGAGMPVGFYDGDPEDGASLLCEARTSEVLQPGQCERVECQWPGAPQSEPGTDIVIMADAEDENGECHEGNNRDLLPGVFCAPLQ